MTSSQLVEPIAPALRLVAALRFGAVLAARPRSIVAHVCQGRTTPSGRWLSRSARPVCRARTARLEVIVQPNQGVSMNGHRLCRRCRPMLPAALGRCDAHQLVTRQDLAAAFTGLTVDDLDTAARWSRTVSESHQVGRVLSILHGEKPRALPRNLTPERRHLQEVHTRLEKNRTRLRLDERDVDQVAADEARRDAADALSARARETSRNEAAIARITDRALAGKYLTQHERDLIGAHR